MSFIIFIVRSTITNKNTHKDLSVEFSPTILREESGNTIINGRRVMGMEKLSLNRRGQALIIVSSCFMRVKLLQVILWLNSINLHKLCWCLLYKIKIVLGNRYLTTHRCYLTAYIHVYGPDRFWRHYGPVMFQGLYYNTADHCFTQFVVLRYIQ